ncbi:MAG: cadherin-like domain-containing protein [Epsilonproteobacteria bacterium]|nr:cadherin-like domain-containing protein [Campylobacterota bacterium]
MVLTFNTNATQALVNETLQSLAYANSSDAPDTSAQIDWTFDDGNSGAQGSGGALSVTGSTTVIITPVNDAPTLTALSHNPTFTEGDADVQLFGFVTPDTIEAGQSIDELVFTVSNVTDGNYELVTLDGTTFTLADLVSGTSATNGYDYSVSLVGTTATITLTTLGATPANIANLGGSINYRNSSENPTTSDRVFTISSITDSGGTLNGGVDTSSPNLVSIVTMVAINDAPTSTDNTLSIGKNSTYIFVTSDFNYSDVDGDPLNSVKITTLETVGTLQLSGTDVTLDQVITAADIDSGLLTFTPIPDAAGGNYDSFTFSVNDGMVDSAADSTMTINVLKPITDTDLLLSTDGDVNSPSGANGLDSWTSGNILSFGGASLDFETGTTPGTTEGDFNISFSLNDFTQDGSADVRGMHYVTESITMGSGANTFNLQAGDILFATQDNETFTSSDSSTLSSQNTDIVVFRADVSGDYSSGTFTTLLDDPFGTDKIHAFTLVEQDTTIGDTVVTAGSLLAARAGSHENIYLYEASDVGTGTTIGTETLFIQGSDIGNGTQIQGLELIESNTVIGRASLASGNILLTLNNSESGIGDSALSVTENDVFYLDVSTTTLVAGSGNATANAVLLMQGNEVGLDTANEDINALSLAVAYNNPPVAVADSFTVDEGSSSNILDLAANDTDVNGDLDVSSITIVSGPSNGSLVVNADGTVSYSHDGSETTSDSFTYTIDDSVGTTSNEVVVDIAVAPVNDAPILDPIGNQNVDELSILTFTATASDADIPADTLTFTLDATSLAAGMSIDANTGVFSWTPTESDGGTTPTVTITVTDSGTGNLVDSETFTITVNDINTSPILDPIGNQNVDELSTLTFTATATDVDGAENTLTYSLDSASLAAGMHIDPSTGIVTWSPSSDYTGSLLAVTVTVTDSGTGNLIDSETLTIDVVRTSLSSSAGTSGEDSEVLPLDENIIVFDSSIGSNIDRPDTVDLLEEDVQDHIELAVDDQQVSNEYDTIDLDNLNDVFVIQQPYSELPERYMAELESLDSVNIDSSLLSVLNNHESENFYNDLDKMYKEMDENAEKAQYENDFSVEVASGITLSLTAGFVAWLFRSGSLIASLFATMPMWKEFDPVAIFTDEDEDEDEVISHEDESIEQIFEVEKS